MKETALVEISGVGPMTAQALEKAGFNSAESIARSDVGALTLVSGIGVARDSTLRAAAQRLLDESQAPNKGSLQTAVANGEPSEKKPSNKAAAPPKKKVKPPKEVVKLTKKAEDLTRQAEKLTKKADATKSKKKRRKRLRLVAELEAAAKKARKKANKLLARA